MNQQATMRLAIETLLEVVESEKNIELCLVKAGNISEMVSQARIQAVVNEINAEKEAQEDAHSRSRSSKSNSQKDYTGAVQKPDQKRG